MHAGAWNVVKLIARNVSLLVRGMYMQYDTYLSRFPILHPRCAHVQQENPERKYHIAPTFII